MSALRRVCRCGHADTRHADGAGLDGSCTHTGCSCAAFDLGAEGETCAMCRGSDTSWNAYARAASCPRCAGSGIEPADPPLHVGQLLRNRRSGKVWAVFAAYDAGQWGIHRMKPSRSSGFYVWQIQMRPAEALSGAAWQPAGVGDAWNSELMETDPI